MLEGRALRGFLGCLVRVPWSKLGREMGAKARSDEERSLSQGERRVGRAAGACYAVINRPERRRKNQYDLPEYSTNFDHNLFRSGKATFLILHIADLLPSDRVSLHISFHKSIDRFRKSSSIETSRLSRPSIAFLDFSSSLCRCCRIHERRDAELRVTRP